jgi:hypothetical protein
MSNQHDSNVIQVDFSAKRSSKEKSGTQPFSTLIDNVMTTAEGPDEWPEDLTPKERCNQLKKDLDFLRKMNDTPVN